MKSKKPLAPWLPGVYGKMTREEFDALSDSYDREFSTIELPTVEPLRPHPRRRGRPKKPTKLKAKRILMTIEPELLAKTDAAARKAGLTRAGLLQNALRTWLAQQPGHAKAA